MFTEGGADDAAYLQWLERRDRNCDVIPIFVQGHHPTFSGRSGTNFRLPLEGGGLVQAFQVSPRLAAGAGANYDEFAAASKSLLVAATEFDFTEMLLAQARLLAVAGYDIDVILPTVGVAYHEVPIAEMAHQVGIPWHHPELVRTYQEKWRLNQLIGDSALPCVPRGSLHRDWRDLCNHVLGAKSEIVVKLSDGVGGKGAVQIVPDMNYWDRWAALGIHRAAQQATNSESSLIEPKVPGQEHGVYFTWVNGQISESSLFITTKRLMPPPYCRHIGHVFDPEAPIARERIAAALTHVIETVNASLAPEQRLQRSAFNADVIVGPDESVTVVDMSPREGGTGPQLMTAITNSEIHRLRHAELVEGATITYPALDRAAVHQALYPWGGTVVRRAYERKIATILRDPDVASIVLGEEIPTTSTGVYYAAPLDSVDTLRQHITVLAVGDDLAAADQRILHAAAEMRVTVFRSGPVPVCYRYLPSGLSEIAGDEAVAAFPYRKLAQRRPPPVLAPSHLENRVPRWT